MDILIIANYCGNLDGSDNNRFVYLAEMLAKKHDVELVSTNFDHMRKQKRELLPTSRSYKLTCLEEPGYKKNISIKRIISHYRWGKNVKAYLTKRNKPDVIYYAIPTLTGGTYASKYCAENNVPFVIDIQDIWPEAFQMIFNPPLLNSVIYKPFKDKANDIYYNADDIIAVSRTYVNRALQVNKKVKEGKVVFLGTDISIFDENANKDPWIKKEDGEVWLGYCGTLGSSYDLTCVFDALNLLNKQKHIRPKLVVMGDGPRRKEFEEYVSRLDINVVFLGMLEYETMCATLKECDIAINPIMHGAAQSIINKHADYAAAGIPVISTQENEEYRQLVEEYRMGYNCDNGNSQEIANCIEKLIANPEIKEEMGKQARMCAMECFDRKGAYSAIETIIETTRRR